MPGDAVSLQTCQEDRHDNFIVKIPAKVKIDRSRDSKVQHVNLTNVLKIPSTTRDLRKAKNLADLQKYDSIEDYKLWKCNAIGYYLNKAEKRGLDKTLSYTQPQNKRQNMLPSNYNELSSLPSDSWDCSTELQAGSKSILTKQVDLRGRWSPPGWCWPSSRSSG